MVVGVEASGAWGFRGWGLRKKVPGFGNMASLHKTRPVRDLCSRGICGVSKIRIRLFKFQWSELARCSLRTKPRYKHTWNQNPGRRTHILVIMAPTARSIWVYGVQVDGYGVRGPELILKPLRPEHIYPQAPKYFLLGEYLIGFEL